MTRFYLIWAKLQTSRCSFNSLLDGIYSFSHHQILSSVRKCITEINNSYYHGVSYDANVSSLQNAKWMGFVNCMTILLISIPGREEKRIFLRVLHKELPFRKGLK